MKVLLASDSTYVQEWIVDDDEEVGNAMGEDGSPGPRRSNRIRELYEDDFKFEDEEEINENEVEFELDGDLVLEDYGEKEQSWLN